MSELSNRVKCRNCDNRAIVAGLCAGCASKELALSNRASELHALVECANVACKRGVQNQHSVGGMCPTCAEAELTRLRGIEAAVMTDAEDGALSADDWRELANGLNAQESIGWPVTCAAIADALEAKP